MKSAVEERLAQLGLELSPPLNRWLHTSLPWKYWGRVFTGSGDASNRDIVDKPGAFRHQSFQAGRGSSRCY
jgi:hypothetical protein